MGNLIGLKGALEIVGDRKIDVDTIRIAAEICQAVKREFGSLSAASACYTQRLLGELATQLERDADASISGAGQYVSAGRTEEGMRGAPEPVHSVS